MLFLSILLLAFGLFCSAHPLEERQSRTTEPFKLYAYGPGISGLPVFYRNGTAQVADASKVDTTTMAAMTPINFTASTGNTFVAHPSSRTSSTEDFTTLSTNTNMLCLDRGNTDSNPVGFTGTSAREQSNTTRLSNVWSTYGSYVLVTVTGANFYARQTGTDGLYSLLWSSSAEAMTDTIPLVLRTTEPATVSVLT
ncbi:hypothetical protein PENPOL_c006G04729 [Penicillium polonicum]|uniref:Uncharacterized protein n=1 Tax=Penicillium polonicum TaxID=60169 RepID=A0A1V6NL23_PENPO|nr:hypothetical protein PENPOL_c006G04729 [Penicillium polonicum]